MIWIRRFISRMRHGPQIAGNLVARKAKGHGSLERGKTPDSLRLSWLKCYYWGFSGSIVAFLGCRIWARC